MPRWKMKVQLLDLGDLGREHHVVLALYGDDKMPIERHSVQFSEFATKEEVAEELCRLGNLVLGDV